MSHGLSYLVQMTAAHQHFVRLLSAFSSGHTGSAETLRRSLCRNNDESPAQRDLLTSLEFLEEFRKHVDTTLDSCERSGFSAIAKLCRDIVNSPLCTFDTLQQWGVCAVTGRTVNRMLQITSDTERTVDDNLAQFLISLWSVSHFELIESARAEVAADDDTKHVCAEDLVASYVSAFQVITTSLQSTLLSLSTQ